MIRISYNITDVNKKKCLKKQFLTTIYLKISHKLNSFKFNQKQQNDISYIFL